MNISQVPKYVNAIANMARWSQTTFIRTFYKFKPHMIEKKVKKLAQHPKVDGVFVTSETDNPKMNHLHLAIAGKKLSRDEVGTAMNLRTEFIGNIEPIRGKKQTLQYISKQLTRQERYIDAYHDLFINSKTQKNEIYTCPEVLKD